MRTLIRILTAIRDYFNEDLLAEYNRINELLEWEPKQ